MNGRVAFILLAMILASLPSVARAQIAPVARVGIAPCQGSQAEKM